MSTQLDIKNRLLETHRSRKRKSNAASSPEVTELPPPCWEGSEHGVFPVLTRFNRCWAAECNCSSTIALDKPELQEHWTARSSGFPEMASRPSQAPLPPWGNALAGATGAVLANAIVYPLDM